MERPPTKKVKQSKHTCSVICSEQHDVDNYNDDDDDDDDDGVPLPILYECQNYFSKTDCKYCYFMATFVHSGWPNEPSGL